MGDAADIRCATSDDLEALFDLHRTVFRSHIEQIWGWDETWQRSRFQEELDVSSTSVIEVAGRAVGYLCTDRNPRRLFLRTIAVHPDVQGRGIGTSLVRRLQQEAAEHGIPVELQVFSTNPRAREFYERLGFRKSGRTDSHIEMSWHPASEGRPDR